MNRRINLIYIVFLFLFSTFSGNTQVDTTNYSSAADIFAKALEYFQDEEYDKAFNEYQKVNYNDTAYFDSRLLAVHCASIQHKYDTVYNLCEEVLAVRRTNPSRSNFLNDKGYALIQQDRFEEAVAFFDEALKEYPDDYLFYFNHGTALYELKRYDEAVKSLQMSIRYNPRYYASHLKLGVICAQSGDLTKSALCFNMAIFMHASDKGSFQLLRVLENLYAGNIGDEGPIKVKFREDEDFDELDLLIKNKVAENSNYKVKTKLQYNFIKHNHLLLEKIEYDPESNGFWNQNYVRVFKAFYDKGEFANFAYFECLSIEDEKAQAVITKNKAKITDFITWAADYFTESMNGRMVWNGSQYVKNTLHHKGKNGFNEDYAVKPDGTPTGNYREYNDEGILIAEGKFSDNGKIGGVWKYYDDEGNLKTEATFVDGELEGKRTAYYSNGSRSQIFMVKDAQIDGEMLRFYTTNHESSKIPFNATGNEHGKGEYYYKVGGISYKVNFVDGKLDGELEEYYLNGQLKTKSNYKAGKLVGTYKTFHENGTLRIEGQYENGLAVGHWKYMHENGQLETEGDYKGGIRVGEWKEFRKNGNLSEESNFGETGKKAGLYKEYDLDGKLILELEYKGDEIVSYKTYSAAGEILSQREKKKNELEFENYHTNGTLKGTGTFYKGERSGVWKFYNQYGVPTTELNYGEEGKLNGKSKWYFDNGQVETVKNYVNDVLDGYFVDNYQNGKIYKEGWFKDGDAVGEWRYYYPDGSLKATEYFIEGETHGDINRYDEKGNLYEISNYYYGVYEGSIMFDSTGKELKAYHLKDGEGIMEFLDANGKEWSVKPYKGGELHGETYGHYPNGQLQYKGSSSEGNHEGDWKWYYENGNIETEGSYKHGYQNGEWKWYYENGKISVIRNFDEGDLEGMLTRYYQNGEKESVQSYRNDERHGESYYYDQSGKVQYIRYYEDGRMLGYSYMGKDGKPVPMVPFDNQDGKMEAYFASGQKSYESEYKNGFNNGKTVYYHANGKPAEVRIYFNDQLHGELKEYYPTGNLSLEEEYFHGELHGTRKEYYANGKVKRVEHYILGDLYGWSETYDEKGVVKQKVYYYNERQLK